jgi:hypothetical protein
LGLLVKGRIKYMMKAAMSQITQTNQKSSQQPNLYLAAPIASGLRQNHRHKAGSSELDHDLPADNQMATKKKLQ